MKILKDEIITKRLRQGDEIAYKQLFETHYIRLVNISYKIVGNLDDARECVQTIFVKLYENRDSVKIKTNLVAYLNRSAVNASINLKDKKAKLISMESSDIDPLHFHEFRDLIEEAEYETKIWDAINQLPLQCRKIFVLNSFEHISNAEIALQLNLSKRTVETQISKALKFLRGKLLIFFYLGL